MLACYICMMMVHLWKTINNGSNWSVPHEVGWFKHILVVCCCCCKLHCCMVSNGSLSFSLDKSIKYLTTHKSCVVMLVVRVTVNTGYQVNI